MREILSALDTLQPNGMHVSSEILKYGEKDAQFCPGQPDRDFVQEAVI
jgi:hypothetical protein